MKWRPPRFRYSAAWYETYVPWLAKLQSTADLRALLKHHFIKCDYRNDPWFQDIDVAGHSLELGFNSGKTCTWMARKYPGLTFDLVDWNKALVKLVPWLREIVPAIRDVHFGDVGEVLQRLEPQTYQNVFSFDFFEHIPYDLYVATIQRVRELLVPGGRLFVYFGETNQSEHVNLLPQKQIQATLSDCFTVRSLLTDKGKKRMFIAERP